MSDAPGLARLLKTPSWGWRSGDGVPRPSPGRVILEIFRNVNPFFGLRNVSTFLMLLWFLLVGSGFVAFWWRGPAQWPLALAYFWVYTVVTNTIWWHRYASHRAFSIRFPVLKRFLRLLTPIYLPVEAYAIPHRVHHAYPDQPGDPYTPLSGYFACMSTEWTTGLLDPDMAPEDLATARRLIEHTGVPLHDDAGFRRWGTVQTMGSLVGEAIASIALHASVLHGLGGMAAIRAACAGLFVGHYLNLDFNFSAHGRGRASHVAGWDFHTADLSLNQYGPGFIGGEWHNNHHRYPGSMRSGFLPGQLDLPFALVKLAERLGLVADVQDHRARFLAERN